MGRFAPILLFSILPLIAGDRVTASDFAVSEAPTELEAVYVLGGSRSDVTQPTAPQRVNKARLEQLQTNDLNKVVKQMPGVYVREEEGEGLRPNIGLRGTNPDRSKKIVFLEDFILAGPAPYSAPAAYYTPSMLHIEDLEIMSGFSAIHHGPNSIGGAINMLGYRVPDGGDQNFIETSYGSFSTAKLKSLASAKTSWGGYAINLGRVQSNGFKQLDGGGDVGFAQNDAVLQLARDVSATQRLLLKAGYANEDSKETYLGLSRADFQVNPLRRYASSALDEMKWNHLALRLTWSAVLNDSTTAPTNVTTDIYHHRFRRTWYRIDRFRDPSINIRSVLTSPIGTNSLFYDVLRGAADSSGLGTNGDLILANNDREFVSQGLQTRLAGEFTGKTKHSWQATVRLHQDKIERDHQYDLARMTNGRLEKTTDARQVDRKNRDEAQALLVSIQDDWDLGNWIVTSVGRFELAHFRYEDSLTTQTRDRDDSVFVPGAGLLYKLSNDASIRGSVNRAVTMAGLDSLGRERREESVNYEVGFKYFKGDDQLQANLTWFFNDYQNLTGTCTASTGCASAQLDQQFNGGRARIQGIEARVADGFYAGSVWIPVQANITLLNAEFSSDLQSDNAEWGIGTIKSSDPLPYVPDVQISLSVGTKIGRYEQEIEVGYQGRSFDQSAQNNRLEIPAFGLLGWSGRFKISKDWKVFAKAENILGKEYLVSMRPFGERPGKPRSILFGANFDF